MRSSRDEESRDEGGVEVTLVTVILVVVREGRAQWSQWEDCHLDGGSLCVSF